MTRTKKFWLPALAVSLSAIGSAQGQVTPFIWKDTLTGAQDWQLDGNWTTAGFPNNEVHTASAMVALGGALNLNVGATDVTVAGLELGGTSSAVATTVSSTGGRLIFRNADPAVTPAIPFNNGNALLVSGGVTGSTNTITAPVHLNGDRVEVGPTSTNDLVFAGNITYEGQSNTGIRSFLPAGKKVVISGNIDITNTFDPLNLSVFNLNDSATNAGTIEITGQLTGPAPTAVGTSFINIGTSSGSSLTLGTVILKGGGTYTGVIEADRGNILLASNNAFGADLNGANPAIYRQGQPSNFGFNFFSDDDTRTISRQMNLVQWQSIKGDHSLTWAGNVVQGNNRGFINLLPEGKKFTVTGSIFTLTGSDTGINPERLITFDGTGLTEVKGLVANHNTASDTLGGLRKRGTGSTYIKSSQTLVMGNPIVNIYAGVTYIDGGNLHFSAGSDLGNTSTIVSTSGAVGLDNGTVTGPDSSVLLTKLNTLASLGSPLPVNVAFTAWDHGGLQLTAGEAGAALDFTMGDLANAADMSVAAPEGGLSYTGTITPADSNYRLGGGSGTLTIPNANQLTGGRNVIAMNGGVVNVTGLQNYSGVTTVEAEYVRSNTQQAIGNLSASASELQLLGTTLQASKLANGGAVSSIGNSSNAASNLVLQGGTLKYTGAGDSTDRSFTIGTMGATLDASGSGAVNFTNTAAPVQDIAEVRSGDIDTNAFTGANGIVFDLPSTADLVVGMPISDPGATPKIPANATITEIIGPTSVRISATIPANSINTNANITFGPFARTLTLTGSNTGANTLAAPLADSSNGLLNVTKTGAGKWILNGATTYTGRTTISAGTLDLKAGAVTTLAGNGLTLATGATLNLELAGASSFDTISLTGGTLAGGGVNLAGTINVATLGGFSPTNGATFDVITMVGLADAPMIITGLTVPGYTASVLTSGDMLTKTLRLTKSGSILAGDYNGNGTVDAADYTLFRDAQGTSTVLLNDPIGGVIGLAHYNQWKNNFGATASAAVAASSAVPEPASLVLLSLVVGSLVACRRGR